MVAGIALGTLQAEEELTAEKDKGAPTATPTVVAVLEPEAAEAAAQPYVPPPLPSGYPPKPPREYELTGSDILYQVRGGDDSCRFLYTSNRTSAFSGVETGLWFVAGTWEMDLAANDEMDLYGPNGPHRFYFTDSTGQATSFIEVAYGATVYHSITFPDSGMYYLYNRLAPDLGAVGEISVRAPGDPPGAVSTEWCPS